MSLDDPRRRVPRTDVALTDPRLAEAAARLGPELVKGAVAAAQARARTGELAPEHVVDEAVAALPQRATTLRAVFNATGVVLHTNLGRAPLATAALDAIARVAQGACNLEYDLDAGHRGSRYVHASALLRELTGAEDAIVVNNCAAALVLALDTLAGGREALVSRGELVEIGGSFRVPDIMAKGNVRLVEVGTTNRTHVADYARAIGPQAGAIVKVHRSNFTMDGFVAEATVAELAPLAREHGVALLHDFGSGLLLDLAPWGLAGEPTLADAVRAGPTLVLASGDKLLGGPQCGIILGERAAIARLRENPLARALRVDKLTLAALEATLALYRDPATAVVQVPALAMLTAPAAAVRARAARLAHLIEVVGVPCTVVDTHATVGGGAFPTARIPSHAVALAGDATAHEAALRAPEEGAAPVIGRIADGRMLLDLRSVPAEQDGAFTDAVLAALAD